MAGYDPDLLSIRFRLPFMLLPRIKIAFALSYCCLAICMALLAYSTLNWNGLRTVIVPSVTALSPASCDKIDLSIAELPLNTKDCAAAKKMFSNRTEELQRLHKSWLFHTKVHESFALYQTIGWAVATMFSLSAVVVLYRMKHHALQGSALSERGN